MTRVRIFAGAGAGLALAALGWCVRDAHGGLDGLSAAVLSRPAGVVLLGLAMVAAGLVFRGVMFAPRPAPVAPAARRASEFRRGFRRDPKPLQPRARQSEVVVTLRPAVAARASGTEGASAPSGARLPPEQLARLQQVMRGRAARLRRRRTEIAKRQFLRNGAGDHDLTGRERPRS